MREAERLLQTGLLTRIYEQTESTGGGVAALDADLRSFLNEYRGDHAHATSTTAAEARLTMEVITTQSKLGEMAVTGHVTQETTRAETALKAHTTEKSVQVGAALRDHIGLTRAHEAQRELEARRERLLRSLKFERMNERRNQVNESYPKTFRWVLDRHDSDDDDDGSDGDESDGDESDVSDYANWESDDSEGSEVRASWEDFSDWSTEIGNKWREKLSFSTVFWHVSRLVGLLVGLLVGWVSRLENLYVQISKSEYLNTS